MFALHVGKACDISRIQARSHFVQEGVTGHFQLCEIF